MMSISPSFRKLMLATHVASSIGWFGSLAAFIALAITGRASGDPELVRACYLAMKVIILFVIVPFSLIALTTGVAQAMLTPWGLLRHYWVLLKLVLTSVATFLLIAHVTPVQILSDDATKGTLSADNWVRVQILAYACGGLVIVTTALILAVFKPRGLTGLGRRMRPALGQGALPETAPDAVSPPVG